MKRKGLMYAVEGVLAALILLMYSSQLFAPPLEQSNWDQNILKQEEMEFLSALDKSKVTKLIIKNGESSFLEILQFFNGKDKIFSITTSNLINPEIDVGVISTDEAVIKEIREKINDTDLNGRKVSFYFSEISLDDDLSGYDVLLIPEYVDLTAYKNKLQEYIENGKGIVELADLSGSDMDIVQQEVFGIKDVDYSVTGADTTSKFNKMEAKYDSYSLRKYFNVLFSKQELEATPDTVALWHFNEDSGDIAYDETLNNNDGTLDGAVWTSGRFENALNFDGENDYVEVPINVFNQDKGTWSLWLYSDFDGQSIENIRVFNSKHTLGDNYEFRTYGGNFGWWVTNGASTSGVEIGGLPDNKWVQIAFSWEYRSATDDTIIIGYKNGEFIESKTIDGKISVPDLNIYLAYYPSSATYFNGIIDEVVIYDRALDEEEVKALAGVGGEDYEFTELNPVDYLYSMHDSPEYIMIEQPNIKYDDTEWNVPVAIANFSNLKGKTVWITNNIQSKEEWNLVKAAILWVSNKELEFIHGSEGPGNSVTVKTMLLENDEMHQPYGVKLRMWY